MKGSYEKEEERKFFVLRFCEHCVAVHVFSSVFYFSIEEFVNRPDRRDTTETKHFANLRGLAVLEEAINA
jgi:hypothetical protein